MELAVVFMKENFVENIVDPAVEDITVVYVFVEENFVEVAVVTIVENLVDEVKLVNDKCWNVEDLTVEGGVDKIVELAFDNIDIESEVSVE